MYKRCKQRCNSFFQFAVSPLFTRFLRGRKILTMTFCHDTMTFCHDTMTLLNKGHYDIIMTLLIKGVFNEKRVESKSRFFSCKCKI